MFSAALLGGEINVQLALFAKFIPMKTQMIHTNNTPSPNTNNSQIHFSHNFQNILESSLFCKEINV